VKYVAGIDGGQTSTTAAIGDESGRVIGRGVAGPADEVGQDASSSRMHDALTEALRAAAEDAGLTPDSQFEAIVAGVSGYEGRVYGKLPQLPSARFVLMHDAPVAHAGALGGGPGVIVIAGTGSVVYATDGERSWTLGGWGYLFGDEGSAFWFSRETLSGLMHAEDIGMHSSEEVRRACEFFGLSSLRAIARAFYAGELTRDRIAAFAAVNLPAPVLRPAAAKLSRLVREAIHRGAPARVALVGGMFSDAGFAATVSERIQADCRGTEMVEPKYDPAAGALLLAYREAGFPNVELRP
jgi:glucosamine kinase